jgi:hypothetical protein
MHREEAARALREAPEAMILTTDFFQLQPERLPKVDAILGNPPYIRYHGFRGQTRGRALDRARAQGIELTGLASSWAHFVAHSGAFLQPRGRLALVLPAELLHTDYAGPIRKWLLERFRSVRVIAFDRMAFTDAEVDAILLLASNSEDDPPGFEIIRVPDSAALEGISLSTRGSPAPDGALGSRWTAAYDERAHALYAALVAEPQARRLGSLARVDIGVVTGANHFFVVDAAIAKRHRLPERVLVPIVESPSVVPGLRVRRSETRRLLLIRRPGDLIASVRAYLHEGVRTGISSRYKCRTRTPWYRVPLPRRRPHAFLPYMNYQAPRLILNTSRAWSTNLVHGVTFANAEIDRYAASAALLSATTMLSAEIEGRAYGGGVLKLETREAERLYLPPLDSYAEASLHGEFRRLDRLVRKGGLLEASAVVDEVLGIDHEVYLRAALVFRARRLGRGKGRRRSA